jgi:formamidopyrimidine-DNA glycosylase
MYQAKLHPEQYSNTFSDDQVKRLHDAIMYVCDTAVEANGDSDKFPQDWLMKHRWGKGKKEGSKLPTGEKITFLKVGGRTSAIVPSVQKKTAAVAGDVSDDAEVEDVEEDTKPKKGSKRKVQAITKEDDETEEKVPAKPKGGRKSAEVKEETKDAIEEDAPAKPKRTNKKVKEEAKEEAEAVSADEIEEQQPAKKRKTTANGTAKKTKAPVKVEKKSEDTTGKRRSGRLSR